MRRLLLILACTMLSASVMAETDDFGIWASVGASKKLSKAWSVGGELEYRSKDDLRKTDRWSVGADVSYKIAKWLKADAGYALLYNFNDSKTTYKNSGKPNKYTPSYWGIRHKIYASLTGTAEVGRFTFSLRERWQYKYRPEKTVDRWDYDEDEYEDKLVESKAKNELRSRLQAEYDIAHSPLQPYASMEAYNAWNITRMRYTAGTSLKVNKHHSFDIYYRFQHDTDKDSNPNRHILGIGYKIKL